MTGPPLVLEEFDRPHREAREAGPSPDYLRGFEDGVKAGQHAAENDRTQAISHLVASIQDLGFSYESARQQLLGSLRPLFSQLVDKVVPAIATEGLSARIYHHIDQAFLDGSELPVVISVSSEQLETVESATAELATPDLTLVADPQLVSGQARIGLGQSETLIDIPGLVDGLRAAFAELIHNEEESQDD